MSNKRISQTRFAWTTEIDNDIAFGFSILSFFKKGGKYSTNIMMDYLNNDMITSDMCKRRFDKLKTDNGEFSNRIILLQQKWPKFQEWAIQNFYLKESVDYSFVETNMSDLIKLFQNYFENQYNIIN